LYFVLLHRMYEGITHLGEAVEINKAFILNKKSKCLFFYYALLNIGFLFPTQVFGLNYNTAETEEPPELSKQVNVLPAPTKEDLKRGFQVVKIPKNINVPQEWKPYLNPATEEFWTEGNHRPDAGFVLFARNPSKDTAKLWLLRMEAKAKELQILFPIILQAQKELVHDGYMVDRYNMVKNSTGDSFLPSIASNSVSSQELELSHQLESAVPQKKFVPPSATDLKGLSFYFLFRPGCIHCENLSKSLVGFPNVIPLQITTEPLVNFPGLAKSNYASPKTVENYDPTGETPYLIISNPKIKKITILKGEQSTESILFSAASVLR
jgi:hypothetical protein